MSLFVALALRANHHNSTVSLNHFALIAHGFYRRSNFHTIFSLLISLFCRKQLRLATPRDSAFRQIVRAHFQLNRIPFDDSDIIHTKFTGNIRRDNVTVGKLYLKRCVGQRLDYLSFRFDYVVFGHRCFLRLFYRGWANTASYLLFTALEFLRRLRAPPACFRNAQPTYRPPSPPSSRRLKS